jgi:hypothetical protein
MQGLTADAGMGEYCTVPAGMLHLLPDNVSLKLGALVETDVVRLPRRDARRPLPRQYRSGVRCRPVQEIPRPGYRPALRSPT